MINVYVYDGSFDGFLTAVYEAYYRKDKPEKIISEDVYNHNLIFNPIKINTDAEKALKVAASIKNKISSVAFEKTFYVYLSSVEDSDTLLYNYIRLGFKLGAELDMHMHNPIVLNIHKTSKKVTNECHLMTGFIRFKEVTPNLFYSSIEPEHNIVSLIAPHFAERFSSQNWIIHDLKREIAVIYNCKEWVVIHLEKISVAAFLNPEDGLFYEKLWQNYFVSTAIEERKNAKLQARLMPRRYWNHLTEFQDKNG